MPDSTSANVLSAETPREAYSLPESRDRGESYARQVPRHRATSGLAAQEPVLQMTVGQTGNRTTSGDALSPIGAGDLPQLPDGVSREPSSGGLRGLATKCEDCGQSYEVRPNAAGQFMPSRWCPACRPAAYRRKNRESMRERYWSDREKWRERHRAYNRATGYKYQSAYAHVTCTRCGAAHLRGDLNLTTRKSYVCGKCKADANRLLWSCRVCESTFRDRIPRTFCSDCIGLFARIAKEVGLSRERIRQLAHQNKARYRVSLKAGAEMALRQRQAVAS